MTTTRTRTGKKKRGERGKQSMTEAHRADKYALYQQAVQDPEHEVAFFERLYRRLFKRTPRVLREDFCGTFAICCQWAKKRNRQAIGVDLDPEPLNWGRGNNLRNLPAEAQRRVELRQDDVRTTGGTKAHVLAAQNFSFWCFKTRDALRDYFARARKNLDKQGIMVLDMMGGPECMEEDREDVRNCGRFTYVWEQARFDPISHNARFHIHFRFRDGSELTKAFTYDWRFWSIPEVRELLAEAGFSESHVYWEGTDENGEGDNTWRKARRAPSEPAWIAYIAAVK